MKKLTEFNLSRIVRKVISEMREDSYEKLSFEGWSDVWRNLRRQYGDTFFHPDDFGQNRNFPIFTGMNLDFIPKNDGEYLEVMDFYRDPKNWSEDIEKGYEILDRVENRLRERIENSDAGLRFDSNDRYRFRIYKKYFNQDPL